MNKRWSSWLISKRGILLCFLWHPFHLSHVLSCDLSYHLLLLWHLFYVTYVPSFLLLEKKTTFDIFHVIAIIVVVATIISWGYHYDTSTWFDWFTSSSIQIKLCGKKRCICGFVLSNSKVMAQRFTGTLLSLAAFACYSVMAQDGIY